MYESIHSLQIKANRGSKSALDEINKRKKAICNIQLTGIHDEKIVFSLCSDIVDKLYYIDNNIINIDTNKSIMKKQIIIDSYSSATIEGARTTVENVIKALSNKNNKPLDKSNQMVINTVKACNIAYKNEITIDNIRNIWDVITYNVCENENFKGTKFRNGMVYVGNNSKIIHIPCDVQSINRKMKELFSWLKQSNIDIVIKSCILHFYIVYIHPFCDGNGRTARLMHSSYLIHNGYSNVKYISISESINNDINMYYKTLQESEYTYDGALDITPFINYMLDKICDSIDNTISKYNKLSDIQVIILNKMKENGKNSEITVNKACKITKLASNETRVMLNKLVEMNYLSKYKQGKINIYKLK